MLLAYVLRMDERDKQEQHAADYQDTLFAHAFLNQNPELMKELYPEIFGMEDERGVEWNTSPEDFEDFMREWRADSV